MGLFGPPNVDKMLERNDLAGLVRAAGYKKDQFVRQQALIVLRGNAGELVTALEVNLAMSADEEERDGRPSKETFGSRLIIENALVLADDRRAGQTHLLQERLVRSFAANYDGGLFSLCSYGNVLARLDGADEKLKGLCKSPDPHIRELGQYAREVCAAGGG